MSSGATTVLLALSRLLSESPILCPCRVTADRQIEYPAHRPDGILMLVFHDEPEFHGIFPVNTANAFLRFNALR